MGTLTLPSTGPIYRDASGFIYSVERMEYLVLQGRFLVHGTAAPRVLLNVGVSQCVAQNLWGVSLKEQRHGVRAI
jgi:hypothetical protein